MKSAKRLTRSFCLAQWEKCANWVLRDWEGGELPGPVLSEKNRWLVQIPRLWRIFKKKNSKEGKGSSR